MDCSKKFVVSNSSCYVATEGDGNNTRVLRQEHVSCMNKHHTITTPWEPQDIVSDAQHAVASPATHTPGAKLRDRWNMAAASPVYNQTLRNPETQVKCLASTVAARCRRGIYLQIPMCRGVADGVERAMHQGGWISPCVCVIIISRKRGWGSLCKFRSKQSN